MLGLQNLQLILHKSLDIPHIQSLLQLLLGLAATIDFHFLFGASQLVDYSDGARAVAVVVVSNFFYVALAEVFGTVLL